MNIIIFYVIVLISSLQLKFITSTSDLTERVGNYLNCYVDNFTSWRIIIIQCQGANSNDLQILQCNFLEHLDLRFVETKEINFTKAKIYKIERNWTDNLNNTELTWIDVNLSHNKLTTLEVGVFDSLKNLIFLCLSGNQLNRLPVGLFQENTKLGYIFLDNNDIRILEVGLLDNLIKLKYLQLRCNKIVSLPLGIFAKNKELDKIDLSENRLNSLEAGVFANLPKLSEINLEDNQIKRIGPGLFNGLPLTELNLRKCQLKKIDVNTFTEMFQLKELDISGNKLTDLSEMTFNNLTKLESLRLHENQLDYLSENLFNGLKNLRYLDLSSNELEELPAFNEYHKNLTTLRLNHNKISNIELEFITNLQSLNEFSFGFNNLVMLNSDVLIYLDRVEKIVTVGNPWYCQCLDVIRNRRVNFINDIHHSIIYRHNEKPKCINYLFADILNICVQN